MEGKRRIELRVILFPKRKERERGRERGRDERAEATGEDKCGVRGRVDELVSPGFPRLNVRTYVRTAGNEWI